MLRLSSWFFRRDRHRPPLFSPQSFLESMEPRILLSDGVTNTAAPTLHGSAGVPLTNVVIASFTIDDPSALPADQWLGRIVWGDGAETQQIPNTPNPNGTYEIRGTHTYTLAGTYVITEYIGIPFLAIGGHNVVTTSAEITDTAPTLSSITVAPANPSINKGLTQQFAATGHYSDNSVLDLTNQVTWASGTTSVATISATGLASGVDIGTSAISAKLGEISGSTVLTVTAAASPPAVQSLTFDYMNGNVISIQFTQDVSASLDTSDLQLTNVTTGNPVPSAQLVLTYDHSTNIATVKSNVPLADANYHFKVTAASVSNSTGSPLASDASFDLFVLAGDADHDASVGFSDLVAVAQNYGASGRSWSEGDFTGDGTVDFADLVVVAQNYGKSLVPPAPAVAISAAAPVQAPAASASVSKKIVHPPALAVRPTPADKRSAGTNVLRAVTAQAPKRKVFNSHQLIADFL